MTGIWRSMKQSDLADVCQIAAICHPDFPEDDAVLHEKLTLSPDTCFVWSVGKTVNGYLLTHPYTLGNIPPLNELLGTLPSKSDTLFIHDLAILPNARQTGVGAKAVQAVLSCAKDKQLQTLSLVAVNGSLPFWQKQGFHIIEPTELVAKKLLTYSADACYMYQNVV